MPFADVDLCIAAEAIIATLPDSTDIVSNNLMTWISFALGGEFEVRLDYREDVMIEIKYQS